MRHGLEMAAAQSSGKPGPDPKPESERRINRVMASMTDAELAAVKAAAKIDGEPVSVWVRRAAIERAKKVTR